MKTLKYGITINAPVQLVWQNMLSPDSYKLWAKAFSSDSQYRGEWKEGTYINFIDPNMGGSRAYLDEVIPYQKILARHVCMINMQEQQDTESDFAKKWIGTTEDYTFTEQNGMTKLTVITKTDEAFESMFTESWPNALELLKKLCEEKS